MKQESAKKNSKLFLWIGIAAVLVAAGVLLAVFLPGMQGGEASEPAASSKVYWNVDRVDNIDPETGLSARLPGEDGLYHILFSVDGEQVELACADKKLVNKLDLNQLMGLVFDANGQIIDMIKIDDLVGKVIKNVFVQKVTAKGFTTNSSVALNGMEVKYKFTENTKVYDVAPEAEKIGAPGEMVVMDKITVLQDAEGNVTHVFIVESALETRVYWRVSPRLWNSSDAASARQPEADGYCTYEFFVDGQYVTLRTNRQDCMNALDSYANNNAGCGLVLDENGYIIDVCNAARAAKGVTVSNNYTVMSVEGDSFSVEALTGSDQGKTYDGYLNGDTKVYDMSSTEAKIGVETEIRVGDSLLAIADPDGELLYVFVTKRKVDAPAYVVMNRSWSNSKGMTQAPDEDGWYVIDVVAETKRMKVRTKDVGLATQIHEPIGRLIGLRLDGDVVVGVYDAANVTGGKTFALWEYVMTLKEPLLTTQLGSGTSSSTGVISEQCEIYLIGYNGTEPVKKVDKLQEHDRILALTDEKGEVRIVYIYERKLDLPVYWITDGRKWNAAKKETTRVPDEEGYYTYNVTTGGKRPYQVKTKDKKIANFMDSQALTCYTLKVDKNNIVKEAYSGYAGVGGASVASYYVITSINGNRVEAQNSSGTTTSFTLLDGYTCYNVSGGLGCWEYMGEKATPKVGDKIQGVSNYAGRTEVPYIFIVNRPENKDFVVGWKVERKYSTTKAETTREPDENGYYVFDMAVKGEIKTFKTKSKDVATSIDREITAVAMNVKNGIIYRATTLGSTKVYGSAGKASYYTVTKINGKKVTAQNTAGTVAEIVMEKKYECYDVSAHAEKFGAKTTFKVGDKIHAYYNEEETGVILLYVVNAYNRKTEMSKPCPHCGEVVMWSAFNGNVASGHYFLNADRNAGQISIGADAEGKPYDFVLDMNGYDWECPGKALLVWKNAKAYIYDSTGYDYTIKAVGPKDSYHSGVIQMVDGELTLIGGNYVFDDSNQTVAQGGVLTTWSSKAVLNASGVDFVGGTLAEHQPAEGAEKKSRQGAIMSFAGGVANFNDCTFTGGINPDGNGGNLYVGSGTTVNLNGCTVTGGKALRGGGIAILSGKANVTLTDTVVTGNTASSGAGVFVYNGTATLGAGTKVADNKLNTGVLENFWVSGASSDVTMDGAWIVGGAQFSNGKLTVTGNTVIDKGESAPFSLKIADGKLLTVGQLGENAKIGIGASGVFTEEGNIAALTGYVADGKLFSDDGTPISAKGNALTMGVFRCINGHTDHTDVECDEPIVAWQMWNAATAAGFGYTGGDKGDHTNKMTGVGNFILTEDLNLTDMRTTGNGILRIDLNGHNITREVTAETAASRARVFFTWDPNTADTVIPELHLTDLSTEGEAGSVKLTFAEGVTTAPQPGALIYGGGNANGGNIVLAGRVVMDASNLSSTASAINTGRDILIYNATVKSDGFGLLINDAVANVAILGDTEIQGTTDLRKYSSAYVEGNAKLELLKIAEGNIVYLGELGENAEITVDAKGAFTAEGDAATLQSYVTDKKVKASNSDAEILVKDNALCIEIPTIRYCVKGHTEHTGANADCTLEILEWQEWKEDNSLPTSGNWILTKNVTTTAVTTVSSATLCLDLNGFDITRQVAAAGHTMVLQASTKGVVVITDTSGTPGTITSVLADSIKDTVMTSSATGAVLENSNSNAVLVLVEGVIDGSAIKTNRAGGATITINGTFQMLGGTVKGTQAQGNGSALSGYGSSTLEIYGGELLGAVAGNGVYAGGVFTMESGKITCGIRFGTSASATCKITVSGDAVIEGTTDVRGCSFLTFTGAPTVESIAIPAGKKADFTGMTGGSVAVKATGVFTTDFANADAAEAAKAFISAAETGKKVAVSGNALAIEQAAAPSDPDAVVRCINGHTTHEGVTCTEPIVTWKYWDEAAAAAEFTAAKGYSATSLYKAGDSKIRLPGTGNIILTDDVTLAAVRTNGGNSLRIDLNGHDVVRNVTANTQDTCVFNVSNAAGSIDITDLSTEGEAGTVRVAIAEGITPKYGYGGIVYASSNAFKLAGRAVLDASNLNANYATATVQLGSNRKFTMYSGTVKGLASTTATASALHGWNGSAAEIHGGQILSVATENAVYIPSGFTMTAGRIENGVLIAVSSSTAGAVTVSGDAVITGTMDIVKCTGAAFSGAPTVENVKVPSAVKLDLTRVTGGNIGITAADGKFTTDFTSAAAAEKATAFVGTKAEGKIVLVSGKALAIAADDGLHKCINGHTGHAGVLCDQPILTWKLWNEAAAEAEFTTAHGYGAANVYKAGDSKIRLPGTGNLILVDDVTLSGTRATGNGSLRIDLNGHDVIRKLNSNTETALVFQVYDSKTSDSVIPSLVITDSSTEGKAGTVRVAYGEGVTAPKFSYGTAVYVGQGSCTLAGRAVLDGSNLSTTVTTGGATVQVNGGGATFTMYGGAVKGLAASGTSSSAINGWGGSVINIHGGEITSVPAELAVYAGANFTMDGGKITGGVQFGTTNTATGVITVGGTAEIDKVVLKGCTGMTLTGAAKIGSLTNTSGKTPIEVDFTGTVG